MAETSEPTPEERSASAVARLQTEEIRMRSRLMRIAVIAVGARKLAKRNADTILTLGASRSAVLPLWCIFAALLGILVAILTR